MYWVTDGLCFIAGVAEFVLSFVYKKTNYCWIGPLWIAVYPLILEGLLNLVSQCSEKTNYAIAPRSRIVYTPQYNITFCGIQKCHPFDSEKYGNIYNLLVNKGVVNPNEVIVPNKPSRKLLLQTMGKCYLLKLCYAIPLCSYVEMPLYIFPAFLLRWRVLDPMLRAAEGSILAACIAERLGWAVNLSGGYHHASSSDGGGFCIYPDITMIVNYLRSRSNKERIMIIDLDVHQGNGHERDHVGDKNTYIVDCYNHKIYPNDEYAKNAISRDMSVDSQTQDKEYRAKVQTIEDDINSFDPDFVIYNAGTDILDGDPLGRVHISKKGIIERDELIIGMCRRKSKPVVMLMSGGYQKINAQIIAESIDNLIKKFGQK